MKKVLWVEMALFRTNRCHTPFWESQLADKAAGSPLVWRKYEKTQTHETQEKKSNFEAAYALVLPHRDLLMDIRYNGAHGNHGKR